MKKLLFLLPLLVSLSACGGGNSMEDYKTMKPKADIKAYFNGPIKAWGIVQDWRGRVKRSFEVEMVGTWEGDVGTLNETFLYNDGETQKRVWTIHKISDDRFEGEAGDILGKAIGESSGNAINWHYAMNLPVGDTTYHVKFDDWMWQLNDDILINRSYIKKFGITVAELSLFMQKQEK